MFNEPNATLPFVVIPLFEYFGSPSMGSVTVNGTAVGVSVVFLPGVPALEELLQLYAGRADLQSMFPGAASGNTSALVSLVGWASEVVSGQVVDPAYDQLAAPDVGYYYALMGVYNARADVQAAFPNATTDPTSYQSLLWWAGQVVAGTFPDSARTTLDPWAAAYDLFAVYVSRPDLQSAFPYAPFNLTSASALVDWAGGVVLESYPDSALATLTPYGYWYVLLMVYNGRSDLQSAFPGVWSNESAFVDLANWAGAAVNGTFYDSSQSTLAPFGYWYVLMWVYNGRADLQVAFPDAASNGSSYQALLVWANDVVTAVFSDSSYSTLLPYASQYETYG